MDPPHPHLIGDCLIHIFSFLTEEDLISASSACKVRSVQHAEVVCYELNNSQKCLICVWTYVFRTGMKL